MRTERVPRAGEADLIRVETNYDYPPLSGDHAAWACHNIAEAVALELVQGAEYVEMKSRIWSTLAGQSGLMRAIRRAARVKRATAPDGSVSDASAPTGSASRESGLQAH